MTWSSLSAQRKCTKCGETFIHFRGSSDSRCESCWDDEPEQTTNEELLSKFQTGEVTL